MDSSWTYYWVVHLKACYTMRGSNPQSLVRTPLQPIDIQPLSHFELASWHFHKNTVQQKWWWVVMKSVTGFHEFEILCCSTTNIAPKFGCIYRDPDLASQSLPIRLRVTCIGFEVLQVGSYHAVQWWSIQGWLKETKVLDQSWVEPRSGFEL